MKTIAELVDEIGVHRTTLNKAIEREEFPARKSGDTWLIDETSIQFKVWRESRKRAIPAVTIEAETAEPPAWVNTRAARHAWHTNLPWHVNAASADSEQYRQHLLREADRLYNGEH